MSLVKQLTERFQNHEGRWIPGGSIEKYVIAETEYTASNARRRLREMVEDGILKQKEEVHNGKNHAYYMYDPNDTTVEKPKKSTVQIVMVDGKPVAREAYA